MIIFFFCLIIISVLGYLSLIVKTAIRIGLGNKAPVNKGNVAMNWLLLAFFVIGIYGAIFFPPNLISNKTSGGNAGNNQQWTKVALHVDTWTTSQVYRQELPATSTTAPSQAPASTPAANNTPAK